MHLFIYEHLTAFGPAASPPGMYGEGRAMRDAVAADFARLPGAKVFVFPDAAAPVAVGQLAEAAATADWTLLIAPECDDCLASLADAVLQAGGRLLGPSPAAIRLTADKLALFLYWRAHGIPTPATRKSCLGSGTRQSSEEPLRKSGDFPYEDLAFPLVWKPRDGAGSTLTFLLESSADVVRARAIVARESHVSPMVLQEFVPGLAASLAFLCGPAENTPLVPASQRLTDDGRFAYQGGELPLPDDLNTRAIRLGQRAINCVPGFTGYIGIDLVLGAAADGSQDYAIEINPRLATSYVGLRRLAEDNLAEKMLDAAKGNRIVPIRWRAGKVRFDASGRVGE